MKYSDLVRCKVRYSDHVFVDDEVHEVENWAEFQFDKNDITNVSQAIDINRKVAGNDICLLYLKDQGSFTVDIPFTDALILHSEKYAAK